MLFSHGKEKKPWTPVTAAEPRARAQLVDQPHVTS
jgi:hypothetical protein